MTRGELKELIRFYISELTDRKSSDSVIETIIKQGVRDVAHRTACLKATGDFDALTTVGEYRLSSKLTRYLAIDDEGIWWNNGDTWEELDPVTVKYMDNHLPNWRDDEDGSPQRYALRGDLFIPHPTPEDTQTSGFRAYFIQEPPPMTTDAHFPFPVGDTQGGTERSDLAILSDSIILYVESKVLKALNKRQESYEKINEYREDLEIKKAIINTRRDVNRSDKTKMMGPRVG